MLEVDVDVRRLGLAVDARFREKALEQKAMLHRIDGRDAETERDGGVGGAASALAKDSFVLGEPHRVGHHEKESGEAQVGDEPQLVIDLLPLLRRRIGPAFAHALLGPAAERDVVVDVGEASGEFGFAKIGQRRAHPFECESRARLGDANGFAKTLLASSPAFGHLFGREEPPFAVGMQQPALGGFVDREIVTKRGEHVVHEPARFVGVAWVLRREPRKAGLLSQLDELSGERGLVAARVVQLDFYRKATVVENIAPASEGVFRRVRLSRADVRRELAGRRAGEGVQPG